jgi:hypothetical protein
MTTLTYSISTDFHNATQVFPQGLINILATVSPVDSLSVNGDAVVIYFLATLTGPQISSITSLINAYVYVAPIITSSNVYSAIVSSTPFATCDYTSIAAAFAAGATSVFVTRGTYIETANIVIPAGGQLHGECPGSVIINFSGAFSILADGSGGVNPQTAGTVSITANTSTVTGVGTTFTALAAGQYILLNATYHKIVSIASDTQLTISGVHYNTLTNVAYQALSMNTGCKIENITISASTTSGIILKAIGFSSLSRIVISGCAQGISYLNCNGVTCSKLVIATVGTSGVSLNNNLSVLFSECLVTRCGTDGIVTSGTFTLDNKLSTFISKSNAQNGFNIGSGGITLDTCGSEDNGTNGVMITGTGATIGDCTIKSNGADGINVSGTNTIIYACALLGNATDGINISADSALISSCNIASNTGNGVTVNANNCIVQSSQCNNNANGIVISNTSTKTIVNANNLLSNTTTNLQDNGISTVVSANVSS